MTIETMTLTRALAETKTISKKLEKSMSNIYIAYAQGLDKNKVVAAPGLVGKSLDEVETSITANFQSTENLIKRYRAIKKAIILANATTEVSIAGEVMTIAEAIERKNSIELDKNFLNILKQQQSACNQALSTLAIRLSTTIERAIDTLCGSDRSKINEDQIKILTDTKKQEFEPSLIDPNKISQYIEKLQENIEQFELEINFSLSEINAKTELTIEY